MNKFILMMFVSSFCFASFTKIFDQKNEAFMGTISYLKIQAGLEKIFLQKNELSHTFCKIISSADDLNYSIGLNMNASEKFIGTCQNTAPANNSNRSKQFRKKYIIFKAQNSVLRNYSSWTTRDNITYINENILNSETELLNALVHEIAIAVDAKSNLTYETALNFDPNLFFSVQNNLNNIKSAFKYSTYLPIQYAFSALRAFSIENKIFKNKISTDHEFCQKSFLKIMSELNQNHLPRSENLYLQTDEALNVLNYILDWPNFLNLELKFLLNSKLRINSGTTFCQYMATPLLSANAVLTAHGSGPRPNFTGGWTTGGKPISMDEIVLKNITGSILKTESLLNYPTKNTSENKADFEFVSPEIDFSPNDVNIPYLPTY
jgi:hypothetical protein